MLGLVIATMGCGERNPVAREELEVLRLVVETGGETDSSTVARKIATHLKRPAQVEPLFPDVDPADDPDGLAEMFLVIVPEGKAVSANGWDMAYELRDATGFARVEPDQERTLEEVAARMKSTCFVDDSSAAPEEKTWSLDEMNVRAAWELEPAQGGRRRGEGIRICHPDTGWAPHRDLDMSRLDLATATNLLAGGTPDGQDPLDYSGPFLNPGHGTGTASVIVSGEAEGLIVGVAPAATLVPIRTAKSVVQLFDSDLARAVRYAVQHDCDVISMSLGGRAFFGLSAAVRNAKRNNLIVLAAAGNCVGFVVAPAAYDDCVAVAATNANHRPWKGSSRGKAVEISAPGEHVWVAHRQSRTDESDVEVRAGEGTSFAVAGTAGVAALWLAHHDLGRFATGYGDGFYLQDAFVQLLQATAQVPQDWDSLRGKYGAGIVDAKALLERALPGPDDPARARRALGEATALQVLADMTDRSVATLAPQVARLFHTDAAGLDSVLAIHGAELIELALRDPQSMERTLDEEPSAPTARAARKALSSRASKRLRNLMQ